MRTSFLPVTNFTAISSVAQKHKATYSQLAYHFSSNTLNMFGDQIPLASRPVPTICESNRSSTFYKYRAGVPALQPSALHAIPVNPEFRVNRQLRPHWDAIHSILQSQGIRNFIMELITDIEYGMRRKAHLLSYSFERFGMRNRKRLG